jgi:hypothetical protein
VQSKIIQPGEPWQKRGLKAGQGTFGRTGEGRFLPPDDAAAAGTKASHEVMELVRETPALSFLVMQLRATGQSWA